jgi:hypothetical protein
VFGLPFALGASFCIDAVSMPIKSSDELNVLTMPTVTQVAVISQRTLRLLNCAVCMASTTSMFSGV